MTVTQDTDDELNFEVHNDFDFDAFQRAEDILREFHNVSSGLATARKAFQQGMVDWHRNRFLRGAVYQEALQLDPNLTFTYHPEWDDVFFIRFKNRSAAALFKLTWVGKPDP